jgi:undecaprenyl-diphosphatase
MLGAEIVMLPVGAVVCWRLTVGGHGRKAILLAGGTLSAQLFSAYLKMFFHRVRPGLFFTLPLAQNYSFPSGHAFVGTVFYGLLAGVLVANRGRRIAIVVVLALLIGLSRVYLGYHYPSDVFAGWACAVAWLALAGAPIDASRQPQK